MEKISILGSTGSIGSSTLEVVQYHQEKIEVVALAAHSDIEKLQQQIVQFRPEVVGVYDEAKAVELQKLCPDTEVIGGIEGLIAAATCPSGDMVISAIAGTAWLVPIIPTLIARMLTDRMKRMLYLSALIGLGCSFLGVALARYCYTAWGMALSTSGVVVCLIGCVMAIVSCWKLFGLRKVCSV